MAPIKDSPEAAGSPIASPGVGEVGTGRDSTGEEREITGMCPRGYEFLDDLATADIAFRAWGESLDETFRAAADATLNVMVEDLDSVQPRVRRDLRLENEAADLLLFDLLQELIYYKDSEALLLRVQDLRVQAGPGCHLLEAIALGEEIDADRHPLRVDVKAITLHGFRLAETERGWEAQVILDI
jgi:SHS2 domain-containing protein